MLTAFDYAEHKEGFPVGRVKILNDRGIIKFS